MERYKHLSDSTKEVVEKSLEDRISWLYQSRWIGYSQAIECQNKLNNLLSIPRIHRMPNILLLGHTNNGKTSIVQRFLERNPIQVRPNEESAFIPVVYTQAPPVPDEGRFYNSILEQMFAPFKATDHVSKRQSQVINILKSVETKVIIIDEIHHIIAGHYEKQRQFLNVIKYLGNELRACIVGVGTKEALRAIQSDPQLANRFEPIPLPKWQLNKDFQQLLASFERVLPLKEPSKLHQPELAKKLLHLSEGTIGELSSLLNRLTEKAVYNGREKIDIDLLLNINWVAPSDRRKVAEKLL